MWEATIRRLKAGLSREREMTSSSKNIDRFIPETSDPISTGGTLE